ncbi:hypothetical protein AaE_007723 [Aphanomyces astaci]|uniref:Uncharacterized protein n=1 Tax=Aphanomyces astaci TaxID=112090 RepID=A0A6A4ZWS4_APHAT|nr:hypothetical protein AaE_007723 [Aphanomyces astaci]
MVTRLAPKVTLASTMKQPTGIPPHVSLHSQLETNLAAIRDLPGEIRTVIEGILDEKGITSGNITHSLLERLLNNAVARVAGTSSHAVVTTTVDGNAPVRPVHVWGGRWHFLPEDFELPSVDVATAWHYWWWGSPARNIPPLHKINTQDLTTKQGKIYCGWKFAVNGLHDICRSATGGPLSRPYISSSVIAAFTTITESLSSSWGLTEQGRQESV